MARVYLDSCVVIYLIQAEEAISGAIRDALQLAVGPTPVLCYSDLTRLEWRVGPLRTGDRETLALFDDFFASPEPQQSQLGSDAFDLAAEIRASHGLKTPDALHLAAAMLDGCEEFWTNDCRLATAAGDRIALRVLPSPLAGGEPSVEP